MKIGAAGETLPPATALRPCLKIPLLTFTSSIYAEKPNAREIKNGGSGIGLRRRLLWRPETEEAGFTIHLVGKYLVGADRVNPAGNIAPACRGQVGAGLQCEICGRGRPGNDREVSVYKFDVQEDGRIGPGIYIGDHQAESRDAVNALAKRSRRKDNVCKSSALRAVVQQGKRVAVGWQKTVQPGDAGGAVKRHTTRDINLPETGQAAHAKSQGPAGRGKTPVKADYSHQHIEGARV